ncbi:MAG: AIR synthase-related protein [Planctomycetota bacterium]|nr:AIR synthase-related protein [Planctomycetota bacterium]
MTTSQRIQMAHGGGGQLTGELLREVILPALCGAPTGPLTDAAEIAGAGRLAFTTDTYVVHPLEFPGGDIGKLAVCGTVNDLAAGRKAAQIGVPIVTGDTKVVGREGCDGLIINTAGVGRIADGVQLGFARIAAGDKVLLSGPLGEHSLTIMTQREGLRIASELTSDCEAIDGLTRLLVGGVGPAVKFMRDPTRGGLAAVLADAAEATGRDIAIDERAIPVNRTARAAAEMLGLDLLAAANEGKLVAFVAPEAADEALRILRGHELARQAAIIGEVGPAAPVPMVEMITAIGGCRVVQMPYGEDLPRIC